ncbi:MAG: carbohydrate kinase [Erysipelotrichaceae bacterium]|nr:carbohydrate kinase [Erysipelotrichaceae bacterium]
MLGVIGEILVDLTGKETNGGLSFTRHAGGAPFNVALAAKRLGAKVGFFGSIGDDMMGHYLEAFAKAQGFDELALSVLPDRNTTLAWVSLEHGERSFSFTRKHTADYCFPNPLPKAFLTADLLHCGTLMFSEAEGRDFVSREIAAAKKRGQTISFDVNYRDDLYTSSEEAVAVYRQFLPFADLLKFSEEEVAIFGEDYVSSLSHTRVFITHGAKGSEMRYQEKRLFVPSYPVTPLDTTGAGDAFYGALLSSLEGKDFSTFSDEEWRRILAKSNAAGALSTLAYGACDGLPTQKEIKSFLAKVAKHV